MSEINVDGKVGLGGNCRASADGATIEDRKTRLAVSGLAGRRSLALFGRALYLLTPTTRQLKTYLTTLYAFI